MLYKLRANELRSCSKFMKINSSARHRIFNSSCNIALAKRYRSSSTPKHIKGIKESNLKRGARSDTFEYKQPLANELRYVEEHSEYVDKIINDKVETILEKYTNDKFEVLNDIITENLYNSNIRNDIFDTINGKLRIDIARIIKDPKFKIHYPSGEQVTLFALYTNKVFAYVDMILSNVDAREGVILDKLPIALKTDSAYKTAMKIEKLLNVDDVNRKSVYNAFVVGWTRYSKDLFSKTIEKIKSDEAVLQTINNPLNWFPKTKVYKRKFFLHVGPTNSGKTYTALNLLKESRSRSFYAGPLRLLAKEIFDKFNHQYKIPCNLLTGEKVINVVDPSTGGYANISAGTTDYIARTIENQKEYDIVVVDEAQLINDEFRGGSILNIIFGCKAKQIHLCGEPRFVPIVKKLCKLMNDDVEIINYERRSVLKLEKDSLPHLRHLKAGDCLIDSSRMSILRNKAKVERLLKHSAATIYGGQPLSIRAFQAHLFNTRQSPILVASNAIGIGMNLNIDQIVFNSLKRGGAPPSRLGGAKPVVYFPDADIKQMAGRAGRNKSFGTVTTLMAKNESKNGMSDYQRLVKVFNKENDPIEEVFASPPMQIISKRFEIFKRKFDIMYGISADKLSPERAYHDHLPKVKLNQLLLEENVDLLMLKHQKGPTLIYNVLTEMENMTFLEKTSLSFIPLKINNRLEFDFFKQTAKLLNNKEVVTLDNCGIVFDRMKRILKSEVIEKYAKGEEMHELSKTLHLESGQNLQDVECISRCLTALLWLNTRYPNRIINTKGIEDLLVQCDLIMHYISEVEPKTYTAEKKYYGDKYKRRY